MLVMDLKLAGYNGQAVRRRRKNSRIHTCNLVHITLFGINTAVVIGTWVIKISISPILTPKKTI